VDRYEVEDKSEMGVGKRARAAKYGKHVHKNGRAHGADMHTGPTQDPDDMGRDSYAYKVCEPKCEDCVPKMLEGACGPEQVDYWWGCECAEETARRYPTDKYDSYNYFPGPNSNTFAQHMADACGLNCSLPVTAIGKNFTSGPGISMHGCGVRVSPLPGMGVTAGISSITAFELTADVFSLPVGISSRGLHCIVTLPWDLGISGLF
jgi:hypothetical protein